MNNNKLCDVPGYACPGLTSFAGRKIVAAFACVAHVNIPVARMNVTKGSTFHQLNFTVRISLNAGTFEATGATERNVAPERPPLPKAKQIPSARRSFIVGGLEGCTFWWALKTTRGHYDCFANLFTRQL